MENIGLLRKELVPCELLVKKLAKEAGGQNKQRLEMVKLFFDFFDDIKNCIEINDDPREIMQVIDSVFVYICWLEACHRQWMPILRRII